MPRFAVAAAVAALAFAACSRPETHRAVVANPIEPAPDVVGATAPLPPRAAPQAALAPATVVSTPARVHQRIDASTAENFVASLQAIEASEAPDKVQRLRGALTVLQLQATTKLAAMARENPTLKAENLSDQQLMQITFGDLNGMTVDQAILRGQEVAKSLLPASGKGVGAGGP